MKTTHRFLLITIALVFSLSACVRTAEPKEPRTITVTGDAEVRVVPDEVILTLGIETWDKDLGTAKSQNDERVKAVLALVQGLGVEAKHIQTEHISIEPRYRDSYEQRDFIGYFVRKTVVVTLKDVGKFETLLSSVLEGGANYVHGIEFRTTELRKHRDAARALAINAAQEKATALAGELKQKVGRPYKIQEEQSDWWSSYWAWWGARWGAGTAQNVIQNAAGGAAPVEGTLAPGQITVRARVSVSFMLQ